VIECGDCREIMRRWIVEGVRVQMCVTSQLYAYRVQEFGVRVERLHGVREI